MDHSCGMYLLVRTIQYAPRTTVCSGLFTRIQSDKGSPFKSLRKLPEILFSVKQGLRFLCSDYHTWPSFSWKWCSLTTAWLLDQGPDLLEKVCLWGGCVNEFVFSVWVVYFCMVCVVCVCARLFVCLSVYVCLCALVVLMFSGHMVYSWL